MRPQLQSPDALSLSRAFLKPPNLGFPVMIYEIPLILTKYVQQINQKSTKQKP